MVNKVFPDIRSWLVTESKFAEAAQSSCGILLHWRRHWRLQVAVSRCLGRPLRFGPYSATSAWPGRRVADECVSLRETQTGNRCIEWAASPQSSWV